MLLSVLLIVLRVKHVAVRVADRLLGVLGIAEVQVRVALGIGNFLLLRIVVDVVAAAHGLLVLVRVLVTLLVAGRVLVERLLIACKRGAAPDAPRRKAHLLATLKQLEPALGCPAVERRTRILQVVHHALAFAGILAIALGKLAGHVDVHGVLVKHDTTHVAHRRMDQLRFVAQLAPPLAVLRRQRARVRQPLHGGGHQVAHPRDVHGLVLPHVRAAQIAVHGDGAVHLGRLAHELARRELLHAVREEVRVRRAERERAELHHTDEAAQVLDLGIGVSAVNDAREIE